MQAKPSYQTNYGTAHPGNVLAKATTRAEPDVALDADPITGVYVYDSYNADGGSGWFPGYGGTSLASPLFAGIVADADENPLQRRPWDLGRSFSDPSGPL